MPQKIFIIACEPSGDLHGAMLVEELRRSNPQLQFLGLGGPRMTAAGVPLIKDMTQISALGFGDVVAKYLVYRKIFYQALIELNQFKPDAVILIDSPAFNLRFAKKIAGRFPVIYYISPQIWAWGGRRIHTIKKTISKMLTILPFEVQLYKKAGVPVDFVGHPLLDHLEISKDRAQLRRELKLSAENWAVGILPGSRQSEVERILPLMLESAKQLQEKMPQAQFFLSQSSNVHNSVYDNILQAYPDLKIQKSTSRFHDLIAAMDFAFITSGTSTLEATLIGTPFFLFYKASWSTYILGRLLIRVPYLGMVNLLLNRPVVPEFIQQDIHPQTIAHEAHVLYQNQDLYEKMKVDFAEARNLLGESGASRRAAKAILECLSKTSLSPA